MEEIKHRKDYHFEILIDTPEDNVWLEDLDAYTNEFSSLKEAKQFLNKNYKDIVNTASIHIQDEIGVDVIESGSTYLQIIKVPNDSKKIVNEKSCPVMFSHKICEEGKWNMTNPFKKTSKEMVR